MDKVNLCCFAVSKNHSLVMVNNYIENNLYNRKIIYINYGAEVENIIDKFYPNISDKCSFMILPNENILNNFEKENIIFVIYGSEKFIQNTNKFLQITKFSGYIFNCYDINEIESSLCDILSIYDKCIFTDDIIVK